MIFEDRMSKLKKRLDEEKQKLQDVFDALQNKSTKALEKKKNTHEKNILMYEEKIEILNQQESFFVHIIEICQKQYSIFDINATEKVDEDLLEDLQENGEDFARLLYIQRKVDRILSDANSDISKYFRQIICDNAKCIYTKGWYKCIIVGPFLIYNQINPKHEKQYDTLYDILPKKAFLEIVNSTYTNIKKKIEVGEIVKKDGKKLTYDEAIKIFSDKNAEKVQIVILTNEILSVVLAFREDLLLLPIEDLVEKCGVSKDVVSFLQKSNITHIRDIMFRDKNSLMDIKYIGEKRAEILLVAVTRQM
jgi:hypothetical protein